MFWMRAMLAVLLLGLPGGAEETIAWGAADGGLRLGVRVEEGDVRVSLRNVGTGDLKVLAGMRCAGGLVWSFVFKALDRQGREVDISDEGPAYMTPEGGYIEPQIVTLTPGGVREFVFPLRELVHFAERREVSLQSLLGQGSALAVSFGVSEEQLRGPEMSFLRKPAPGRFWIGKIGARWKGGNGSLRSPL